MDKGRIIRRPLYTEKSTRQQDDHNQYVFEVDQRANKREIAEAVESLFDVEVTKVRTQCRMGKIRRMGVFAGRQRDWKKAIVTLAEDDSIDLYEGI